MDRPIPQVSIIMETANRSYRSRFFGILKYVRAFGPWSLNIAPGGLQEQFNARLIDQHVDGIITSVNSVAMGHEILRLRRPTVFLDPDGDLPKLRNMFSVAVDNVRIGEMVADYYLANRHVHFGFVNMIGDWNWANDRYKGFQSRLKEHDLTCAVFTPHPEKTWHMERPRLRRWLRKLPTPTAILAASDLEGQQVISACMLEGIKVPFEISVVGGGNDQLLCQSCFPNLSSVEIPWVQAGFEAAAALDQLMNKKTPEKKFFVYRPECVVERESSSYGLIQDPLVIQLLNYIRQVQGFNIRVSDLERQFHISRQWIQKRFKEVMGYPISKEIQNRRISKIKALIRNTDLSFNNIADMCGYNSGTPLRVLFKNVVGITMQEYRDNLEPLARRNRANLDNDTMEI